jgi:hypothetical protein
LSKSTEAKAKAAVSAASESAESPVQCLQSLSRAQLTGSATPSTAAVRVPAAIKPLPLHSQRPALDDYLLPISPLLSPVTEHTVDELELGNLDDLDDLDAEKDIEDAILSIVDQREAPKEASSDYLLESNPSIYFRLVNKYKLQVIKVINLVLILGIKLGVLSSSDLLSLYIISNINQLLIRPFTVFFLTSLHLKGPLILLIMKQ